MKVLTLDQIVYSQRTRFSTVEKINHLKLLQVALVQKLERIEKYNVYKKTYRMVQSKVIICKRPSGELFAEQVASDKVRDPFMKYVPQYIKDLEEAKKNSNPLEILPEEGD